MNGLEVEVKVAVADLAAARARLLAAGATPRRARVFEDNVLYDFPAMDLARAGRLLRLRRRGDDVVLTFKEPGTAGEGDPAMKVMRERECVIAGPGGFEALRGILAGLGLRAVYRYQKHREELDLAGVVVTLDETPIGSYLELEGPADRIRGVASALGVSETAFVKESYRALHARWCEEHGVPMGDMLFGRPAGAGARDASAGGNG